MMTLSQEDMHEYGYTWDGMLPLEKETAFKLYTENVPVYLLYEDDTEALAESEEDLYKHANVDGMFGVEKDFLEALKEKKQYA